MVLTDFFSEKMVQLLLILKDLVHENQTEILISFYFRLVSNRQSLNYCWLCYN